MQSIALYHLASFSLILIFFTFMYLSRTYIRKQHLKRKHGLVFLFTLSYSLYLLSILLFIVFLQDFSAFKGWTKRNFSDQIIQTFTKFKTSKNIPDYSTHGKILWADINNFKAMDLKLLPTLNHCIFVFSFTGMLNARM